MSATMAGSLSVPNQHGWGSRVAVLPLNVDPEESFLGIKKRRRGDAGVLGLCYCQNFSLPHRLNHKGEQAHAGILL